ncbi:hypothetical protein PVK06_047064 [Gossypium arboreum]|uniref:DUF4283 domain-containing protein n=1 Tax=Gossypium arboreum TaxID=29729 RepID=A0ABR0MCB5_GOSAR|nr:hypothetical protein PVK06_047064 [Gossypium arboreum]
MGSGFYQIETPTNATEAEEDEDFELSTDDVERSILNGVPSINFSDRITQILVNHMQLTVVIKLLRRNIGYNALQNKVTALWKPSQPFNLMDVENGYFLAFLSMEQLNELSMSTFQRSASNAGIMGTQRKFALKVRWGWKELVKGTYLTKQTKELTNGITKEETLPKGRMDPGCWLKRSQDEPEEQDRKESKTLESTEKEHQDFRTGAEAHETQQSITEPSPLEGITKTSNRETIEEHPAPPDFQTTKEIMKVLTAGASQIAIPAARGITKIGNARKGKNLKVNKDKEPRVSGRKADEVIAKIGFQYSHRVEARGFSGGIWLGWNSSVNLEIL